MVKQICKIKDVFDLFAGGDVNREHFSAYKTNTHVFGVYSNSLTNHGLYGYTDAPKYAGDSITITGRGSVGHAEYRQFDFDAVIRLLVLIPKGKDILDSRYVTELINNHVKFPLESTGVPQLTVPQIENIELSLPMVEEQRNIAEALSDVDGMISSLEKLIAKKKAVKQGTMQELLTGKKRLPGFAGEWKIYKLDELLQYEQPTKYIVHSAKYTEQGIPVLTAGKSLILGYTTENDGIYENLPVIIFDDFVTSSKYITYRFKVKSSAMKMLTLKKEEMNLKLIFELMQMIDFVPVDHQRHWISQYSQFEIKLPPTIEEQTAIASILVDMDNEIEALEQKLEKTRQIKQGMMQQLLTGKIRLN